MKRYPLSAMRFAPLLGAFREGNTVVAVFQIMSVLMWIRGIAEHFSMCCLLFSIGKKWCLGRASLPQIHVQLQSSPDASWSVVGQCFAVMLLLQQVAIPPYQGPDRDSDSNRQTWPSSSEVLLMPESCLKKSCNMPSTPQEIVVASV